MKQTIRALVGGCICALLALLPACTTAPTDPYAGRYVFKTSGTVTVELGTTVLLPDSNPLSVGSHVFELTPETGRMDISRRGNNTMLVSMNVLGGDVLVYDAELTTGGFRILPTTRQLHLGVLPPMEVTVSGHAQLLDGTLFLSLVYSGGKSLVPGVICSITDSDVVCVASKSK